jgi:hypothetical protein
MIRTLVRHGVSEGVVKRLRAARSGRFGGARLQVIEGGDHGQSMATPCHTPMVFKDEWSYMR